MARKLLVLILIFSFTAPALAQQPPATPAGEEGTTKSRVGGPRRQLATILFAGLGGSILGLSTLSFYGRPQDKLQNIAIGFAVGIIAGTAYVTYKAANNPRELYGTDYVPELERIAQSQQLRATDPAPLSASYTFDF